MQGEDPTRVKEVLKAKTEVLQDRRLGTLWMVGAGGAWEDETQMASSRALDGCAHGPDTGPRLQVYKVPRTFEAAALLPVARTPGLQDLQGGHKAAGSDIIGPSRLGRGGTGESHSRRMCAFNVNNKFRRLEGALTLMIV